MNVTAPWRVALCAGGFAACVALSPHGTWVGALVTAAAVAATWALFTRRRVVTASLAVAACALGTWRGVNATAVDIGANSVNGHLGSGAVVMRGTVADSGVPGRDDTIVVDVHQLATQSGAWSVTGGVVVEPLIAVSVLPGDTVDVQTNSLRSPPQRPGSLSAVALERVGVTAIATAAQVSRLSAGGPSPARLAAQLRLILTATVVRALPEPEATLLRRRLRHPWSPHLERAHAAAGRRAHPYHRGQRSKGADATDVGVGTHIWRWCPRPSRWPTPQTPRERCARCLASWPRRSQARSPERRLRRCYIPSSS